MSTKKMIVLKSSDGETFEVEETVALQSQTIAHLVEDDCDDCVNNGIQLANVKGNILAKVIEYCKKHADGGDSSSSNEDLKKWDAEFLNIDQSTLFNLIVAANYLNIKSLYDLTCQTVAHMIAACKTPAEIRAYFNIKNDFISEEEEEFLKENQWAFE